MIVGYITITDADGNILSKSAISLEYFRHLKRVKSERDAMANDIIHALGRTPAMNWDKSEHVKLEEILTQKPLTNDKNVL